MNSLRSRDWLPLFTFPPFAYCALILFAGQKFTPLSFLFLALYPAVAALILLSASVLFPALRRPFAHSFLEAARLATMLIGLACALRLAAFGPRYTTFDIPYGSGVIPDRGNLWIQPTFLAGAWLVQTAVGWYLLRDADADDKSGESA